MAKVTAEERKAIMARLLPKVFAQAAKAKEYGIDVVGQPYEHWVFELGLHDAGEPLEVRPMVANETRRG